MMLNVVIVLYKKKLSESKAYCSLMEAAKYTDIHLHIWNNSPEIALDNIDIENSYYNGNNTTLPLIYNQILDLVYAEDSSRDDLLMISDDDTDYAGVDLNAFKDACCLNRNSNDCGVYIPRLYSGGMLISPGARVLFKGKCLKVVESGLYPSKNLLAINSGTIITKKCYEAMRPVFDPRLNFYGTDTDFFVRYQNFFKEVYILNQDIIHSLSEHSVESDSRVLFRLVDNRYALNLTFGRGKVLNIALNLYLALCAARISISRRSLRLFVSYVRAGRDNKNS